MAKDTKPAPRRAADDAADSDVQKVAIVPNPETAEIAVGQVLTPGQQAGLDPIDPKADAEQAGHRNDLTNRQTDHERENALDPTSRGPSPGVTPDTPLTARATGSPVTDMSGRPPLAPEDQDLMPRVRDGLRKAKSDDKDLDEAQRGWRTPAQLGIPGAAIKRMVDAGAPLESQMVPGGTFFPETGTRYRVK